jgi:two-component system sensor histidine kinase UhpB
MFPELKCHSKKCSLLWVVVFVSLFSSLSFAQFPSTIDSLKVYLKVHPKDTNYILALNEYGFLLIQEGNFKLADSVIKVMAAMSEKAEYGSGYYKTANLRGVKEYSRQNSQKALGYFTECLKIIEKYKLSKAYYQNILNNISIIYSQMGDRKKATEYAMKLIEYQEKHKLYPLKTSPYDQIGDNLVFAGKYKEAMAYYQRSLGIETQYKSLVNMAIAENRIGNVFELMNQPDEAIRHFDLGLKYAENASYTLLQTDLLTNLGRLYTDKKNWSKAESYLKRSEKVARGLDAKNSLRVVLHNLGDFYIEQKKYDQAGKYYLESLVIAKELAGPNHLFAANSALSGYYAGIKDYKKAYEYNLDAEAAKDSTYKIETEEITQKLLAEYETKEKEQEIALLNEKNAKANLQNKSMLMGGVLLILLAGTVVVFLVNRSKLKRLEESQTLRNKIASDLHDEIGSTLSSILLISGMAKAESSGDKSNRMFSKIHADSQHIVESVDEIIWSVSPVNDSLQGILLRLREYALPLAESKHMAFEFHSDQDIEQLMLPMEIRRNLYLISKEAINNLIKYSEATKANLNFSRIKKIMQVIISDNGKGFDWSANTSRNGLKNMKIRAEEIGGRLDFESVPGGGSKITLSFALT